MIATLDRKAAIADITTHAEALDEERLRELAVFAIRIEAGQPVGRPEYDDDPVLALLKACIPLSREDKRRLNSMLAKLIAKQEIAP